MPLSEDDIGLLRRSFEEVCREAPDVAELFYRRLFEIAPELRPMFRGDLRHQAEKLRSTLGAAIARLHDFAALRPVLADLAQRHVGYGVAPRHYAPVGEALIWAIARSVRPAWDARTEAVWRTAYQDIAQAMISAAGGGDPPG